MRFLLALLTLASPVVAENARVYSGEHGEFTRLVVELPTVSEWTLGRSASGYTFATRQTTQPEYDLTAAWLRISRNRLAALDVDPDSGALMLKLGCECHVFPFEYRPGAIVLDIKPGPAPIGSAFEAAFVGDLISPTATGSATMTGMAAEYDWLAAKPPVSAPHQAKEVPLATGGATLAPLREALIEEIARGAADGIVDISLPVRAGPAAKTETDVLPWSSIRIGEQSGISVSDPDSFEAGEMPNSTCAEDSLLDLGAWGKGEAPLDLLASARSEIYGEFDVADTDAVLRSVRLHLFLGFGAEANQQALMIASTTSEETLALYRSMARIIDEELDAETPFSTMLDCDGSAALWAALARDRLPPGSGVNRGAILRAFGALPPHLRGHLGKGLAEKFLALNDYDAARMIRDTMARAPEVDTAAVALLDAESSLQLGDPDAAQDHALSAVALDANQVESRVTLVETHFQMLEPIDAEVTEVLLSMQRELGDTELAEPVQRAIILSQALSGQLDVAFQHEAFPGKTLADLWRIVEGLASDDDFLLHAVLPEGMRPPDVPPDLDLAVAHRLLQLGFPDASLTWLGQIETGDTDEKRLLGAKALLGLGDAQTAIRLLAGVSEAEAEPLRAQAFLQLNNLPAAKVALAAAGQADAATRAGLWQENWSTVDSAAPATWQSAAQLIQPLVSDTSTGLLGRGAQAVEASIGSRATIEALLATVAAPEGG